MTAIDVNSAVVLQTGEINLPTWRPQRVAPLHPADPIRDQLRRALGYCVRSGAEPAACRLIETALDDLALSVSDGRAADSERHAIREHATAVICQRFREDQLGVGEIAADVMVSRRQLHVIFAEVDQSPYSEILRHRIEEGLRLLRDPAHSELTVTEIARLSGFNGQAQFSRVISRAAGISPRAVRAAGSVAVQRDPATACAEADVAARLTAISAHLRTDRGGARDVARRHYLAAAAANIAAAAAYLHEEDAVGAKAVMRCNALRFIDEQFRNPALDAAAVAQHLGIGVRQLHSLIACEGQTVAGLLRERRTREGVRMLSDPAYAGWTVHQIAVRSGFGAVASFTRAIRASTGRSPSAVRRGASSRGLHRAG